MAHSGAYIRTARYFGGDKFWCEILDGKAFYYGIRGKAHFHLIAIAVRQEYQHQGIATKLLNRIMDRCRENGLNKITLRILQGGRQKHSGSAKTQRSQVGKKAIGKWRYRSRARRRSRL